MVRVGGMVGRGTARCSSCVHPASHVVRSGFVAHVFPWTPGDVHEVTCHEHLMVDHDDDLTPALIRLWRTHTRRVPSHSLQRFTEALTSREGGICQRSQERKGSIFSGTAVAVRCWQGKPLAMSSTYPEHSELDWLLLDGLTTSQHPESTNHR